MIERLESLGGIRYQTGITACFFFLGVPVALGTDFNPNAYCLSMVSCIHRSLKLICEEVLRWLSRKSSSDDLQYIKV